MHTKSLLTRTDDIVHSAQGKPLGKPCLTKTVLWRTGRKKVSPFFYCHCIQFTTANWFCLPLSLPSLYHKCLLPKIKWEEYECCWFLKKCHSFNGHSSLCKHTYKQPASCHFFRRDNYLCPVIMFLLLLWRRSLHRQTTTCFSKNENFCLRVSLIKKWAQQMLAWFLSRIR